ncbi:MAG: Alpha/Beta hydrolase protein [Monoraphidium minutum]|nr:MAG: Alpha/Beta hydrolase protein [Monoraphidium minutum]
MLGTHAGLLRSSASLVLRRAATAAAPPPPPLLRLGARAGVRGSVHGSSLDSAQAAPPSGGRRGSMSEAKRRRVAATAGAGGADGADAGSGTSYSVGSSFKVPGLIATDHVLRVPLDYSGRAPGEITVFVRELVSPTNVRRSLPAILYLQGGPGFESPRPCEASGWIKSASNNFRVLLMDPRGTGLSSQISVKNLAKAGGPKEQARYLSYFRADSIVRDAERVRLALVPKSSNDGRWTILGQSFGGFCAMTYLSIAPHGLTDALLTGGVPPAVADACPAERTYRSLYKRVLLQNARYYARFPDDVALAQRIVRYLAAQPGGGPLLPCGARLTPRAFQLLGLSGLGSSGGLERLHYLLESFFDADGDMSPFFARSFEGWMPWETNPIYALLHEAIYCQGAASNWAAHRVREAEFAAEFDAVGSAAKGEPVNFTGEMVYPWMFEDFAALRPFAAAANLLAAKADWGRLYDVEVLHSNDVAVAAALYLEDMYVDYDLAQETVAHVRGLRQWVTNEYKHSGIRDDGARILDRLLGMARDTVLLE